MVVPVDLMQIVHVVYILYRVSGLSSEVSL